MPAYETPGIYSERGDASAGGISALRTDVAGFVGIAERGPINIAIPVESARQFSAWFGGPIDQGYLSYAARAFFENGGRRMWVVRVGSAATSTAYLDLKDTTKQPVWRIEASSPGVWGNATAVRVTEVRRAQTRGQIDGVDPALLSLSVIAGIERCALIELVAGATVERAVVQSVDATRRTIRLERPLALVSVGAEVRIETVAYNVEVFESGQLVSLYQDLSLVPAHPRYGPQLLKQPWQTIEPARPEQAAGRAPDADLAFDYFRAARNRSSVAPPPIVIRELRNQTARDAKNVLMDTAGATPTARVNNVQLGGHFVITQKLLEGGADGLAALAVGDFIGEPVSPIATAEEAVASRRGLAALASVDEISLLALPDIHIQPRPVRTFDPPAACQPDPCLPAPLPRVAIPPRPVGDAPPRFSLDQIYLVQAAMIDQCERLRDRIALLDAPFDACNRLTFTVSELRAWRARFDSKFGALYAPWLLVVDPRRERTAQDALTRAIPPSGHVAGQAALVDLRSGVYVAPANTPLSWVQDTSLDIDEATHGVLNSLGVNILRAQPGRGVRVLGARTVSSDTDWRFVNVRRLMSMIEKAIDLSIQWAVFEPNDWRTRAKLTLVIDTFLRALWTRGAMVGATAEEAYYVRCDETNNPPATRGLGQLLIEIGVAPSVPFEFIVVRIGRDANGFAIASGEPMLAVR